MKKNPQNSSELDLDEFHEFSNQTCRLNSRNRSAYHFTKNVSNPLRKNKGRASQCLQKSVINFEPEPENLISSIHGVINYDPIPLTKITNEVTVQSVRKQMHIMFNDLNKEEPAIKKL